MTFKTPPIQICLNSAGKKLRSTKISDHYHKAIICTLWSILNKNCKSEISQNSIKLSRISHTIQLISDF